MLQIPVGIAADTLGSVLIDVREPAEGDWPGAPEESEDGWRALRQVSSGTKRAGFWWRPR